MNKIAAILWCMVSLVCMASASAQNATVSGMVTGANGEPVIGANVVVEGTTQGASTDVTGHYTLSNVPSDATLLISYIGYKPAKVQVAGRTQVDIAMQEDAAQIEGVMVVAYGTAKKESFTGSAAVVKGDELQKRVVGNISKSFEGTVAGVQVASGGGQPGEGASVIVRGIGSINAVSTPLYVVDGVPYDGSLSSLNPNDIESMTVLKDASAGALYGSRGANGVIVITTKKGKNDRVRISYKGNVGIASRALNRYDLVNMKDYVEMSYEALRNSAQYGTGMDFEGASRYAANNLGQQIGGLKNPEYYNPYKNYTWETLIDQTTGRIRPDAKAAWDENWMDEISDESAIRTEHIISVNGGSERSNYLVSLGYYKEDGILQNTDFNRYTGRVNVDTQAKHWFKIGMNANFAHSESDYLSFTDTSTSNVWYTAQFMAPVYPVYLKDMAGSNVLDASGNRQYEYGSEDDNGFANRPSAQGFNSKAELYNNKSYNTRNSLSARTYATFGTTREDAKLYGLKFSLNMGTDFNDYQGTVVYNKYHGNAATQGGMIGKTNTRTISYTFNQLLTYDRTFGDHSVNALLGHEYYRYKYNYAKGEKTGIVDGIDELDPAVTTTQNSSYSHNMAIESYFSRLNYGYKDRYYIDASWRTDGSSRFYKSDRWGHFWSVGASWRISEEQFMEGARSWLDNLTLKVSYGVQGNDNLGTYYAWQGNYDYTWANASEAGAMRKTLENKSVTWEKNANLNTGIEATMFNGRLALSVEYYTRKTTDMLMAFPTAPSLGYSSYYANVGDMSNKGIEIDLNFTPIRSKNVQWDISVNLTHLKNKITLLPPERRTLQVDGYSGYTSGIYFYGQDLPMYTFYMKKYAGVSEDGRSMWYKNEGDTRTTTTEYSEASDYLCGNAIPDLFGGFGTSVSFFGFDFGINFNYQIGGKVYDSGYAAAMSVPTSTGSIGVNWHKDMLKAWTPENPNSNIPRLQYGDLNATDTSDRFLTDASYLTLQNINFGYTLPSKFTQKFGVGKLRIYLACENVFYWSKRKGLDPRYADNTDSQGVLGTANAATYSPIRTISGGINIQF